MVSAKIKILSNNKYAQIELADGSLLNKLNKLLSFKEPGVEFTPAFQRHGWNGIVYLMNKKYQFPLGLLGMVQEFLTENKVVFEIIDERPIVETNDPINISKRLDELRMNPRYYQIDAVKKAVENRAGILKLPTGSGKSAIAAILTAALNKPTNIYVIGLDLLQQFHNLFSKIFDEEIGYIGNGICEVKRINIISLWTAAKALSPNKKKIKISDDDEEDKEKFNQDDTDKIKQAIKLAKVVIIDECHTGQTSSFQKIYSNSNHEYIYGLSGTPYKMEATDLLVKALLGNIIFNLPASELIEKGYLVKPVIKFLEVPKEFIENKTYTGIYKEYVVENSRRNRMIVSSAKKLVEGGYQTLVLFRQIAHGKKLLEMLHKEGVEVEMLSGNDKVEKREEIKEKLLSGELKCVLASGIYDIGVDISSLNALVLGSPNKSIVRALQRVGRVIRPFKGKEQVRVIDFWDNALYLKNHSKRRYKIYSGEKGFEVILPKGVKI